MSDLVGYWREWGKRGREMGIYGNGDIIQLRLLVLLPGEDGLVAVFDVGDVEELLHGEGAIVRRHLRDVVGDRDPSLDPLQR